jgi:glutathione S-transferase
MYQTAWATLAILAVYFWTGFNAGRARNTYQVSAPSMEGPAPFQAAQRVQANTLEQLPLALVPLWLCAMYLGDTWAAVGGLAWCVGRVLYALGYYNAPPKREAGFIMGLLASLYLIGGTVWGLLIK